MIGEYALGLVEAQVELVWYSVFALLAAGIIEELVFRGFWWFAEKVHSSFMRLSFLLFWFLHSFMVDFGIQREWV